MRTKNAGDFGRLLKAKREALGLTQMELGKLAGMSYATIGSYEVGRRADPQASVLVKLAKALGISPTELLPGGPYRSQLVPIPIRGQFPPGEPETGSVLIPQEVLGMEASSQAYALHVVDDSLVDEGIHKGDYMAIDPAPEKHSGLFLQDEHSVLRAFDAGQYILIRYPSGRAEQIDVSAFPHVQGRVACHGNWHCD